MKILMVCLGNICRSPLAEGILKSKAAAANLDWQIDSAGTGAWHAGEQPDPRSIATAQSYGIDITNQRARQFTAQDFDRYDLILAMDSSNYNNILQLDPGNHIDKVKLILNYVQPGRNANVPDPYYGGEGGFERVYGLLEVACERIVEKYG